MFLRFSTIVLKLKSKLVLNTSQFFFHFKITLTILIKSKEYSLYERPKKTFRKISLR